MIASTVMRRPRFQNRRRLRERDEHPLAFWVGLKYGLLAGLLLYLLLACVLWWVIFGSRG